MEQGYQVDGVHDRDLIPFLHRSKVCGRGGEGGGKVEPYITHPKGGLMEQGYRSFWIRSHAETIARGQDLANLIYYRNTIAPSTDLTQPIAISLIPTSFRHRFKVYRGGEGGGGGGGGRVLPK